MLGILELPKTPDQPMHPQTINERFVDYYKSLGFKHLPGTSLLHPFDA